MTVQAGDDIAEEDLPTARRLLTALAVERARPERIRRHRNAGWFAVAAVCVGAFMGQLDASIVTLAFAPLQRSFAAGPAAVQWVALSYLLTLVVLLVPIGRLADAKGRKLTYLYGFAVFTAASAACGLAPNLTVLIVMRIIQATGAAMLQANSVALVTTSAPPGRTRAALGAQAAAQALGLALGPVVGGLLVAGLGWRAVFWVNVPVGVLALAAGQLLLPRTRTFGSIARFDVTGTLLLGTAMVALLLAVSSVSGLLLPLPAVLALFAVAVATGFSFAHRLRTVPDPLIKPELLRAPGMARSLGGALCGYLVLFGPLVTIPRILSGHSAIGTGAVMTALPAGFAVAALADKFSPRTSSDTRRGRFGSALAVAAAAALIAAPQTPLTLAVLLFALGLGLGAFAPANNAQIMTSCPAHTAGTAGGLISMVRALGTAIGVAAVTLAIHLRGAHTVGFGGKVSFAVLTVAALLMLASTFGPNTGGPMRAPGASSRTAADSATTESREHMPIPHPSPPKPGRGDGTFFGQPFPITDTVEICFREEDDAANLRAAADWFTDNPGWYLRNLWRERYGAGPIASEDNGPTAVLWVTAECGTDEHSASAACEGLEAAAAR